MDILASLALATDAAGRQNPVTTFSDLETLYAAYGQIKAGQFDAAAMAKVGKLEPLIAAAARSAQLADALLKDPTQGPRLVALLSSIP